MWLRALGVVLCALLFAWPAAAQEQRGTIDGIVKDTSGGVLPGVTGEAKSAGSGVLTATPDANGSFRFPPVLPGTYVGPPSPPNFKTSPIPDAVRHHGPFETLELMH